MIYFILAFLIVLADQASKYLITLQYSMGGHLDIIPGVLRITYATNSGGAFSMFSEHTMVLAIVSAIICVAIIVMMIVLKKSAICNISLGFILGGAIGNLIDRFVMGYVVDMFEPLFIDFAVFNVADIFITVGAVLFVIAVIFFWPGKDSKKVPANESETAPAPSRRAQRHANKYGPDVDEATIVIPTDEVKAAVEEPEYSDIPELYKAPAPAPVKPAAQPAPQSYTAPAAAEEENHSSLDDILNSYFAAINADPSAFEALAAFEERTAEPTAVEEPAVIEDTVVEEPAVVEDPVVEEPAVVEAPVVEEPAVVEAPVVEESEAVEVPVVEEPAVVETPAAKKPRTVSVKVKKAAAKETIQLPEIKPSENSISVESVALNLDGISVEDAATGQFSLDDIMKEYGEF